MSADRFDRVQRTLVTWGAGLFSVGLATGAVAAFALSGKLAADGRMLLGAHVSALMGAFWCFAVAWTMPLVRFGEVGRTRLATAVLTANWSNWFISAMKAWFFVHGVGFEGNVANDAVHVALNVFVVVPALGAAIAWTWGMTRRGAAEASVAME